MVSRQFHFNGFGANMLYFFALLFVGSICYPNIYYRALIILNYKSAVNAEHLAGYELSAVGAEENCRIGNILRRAEGV